MSDYPGVEMKNERDVMVDRANNSGGINQSSSEVDPNLSAQIALSEKQQSQNIRAAALETASQMVDTKDIVSLLTTAKMVEDYLAEGTLPRVATTAAGQRQAPPEG